MNRLIKLSILSLALFAVTEGAFAFGGCGEGSCVDCHSLSKEQAQEAIAPLGLTAEVIEVKLSKVPGLWSIAVFDKRNNKKIPLYIDYSKKYLIQGDVVEIATRESLTRMTMAELNRVNTDDIPLDDALVLGSPKAKFKVIVFDDPECPFCKKFQEEMKKVVAKRSDIAFYIKMLPLKIHPKARAKAEAIICAKSLELLDKTLAGEEIPAATCKTDQIDKNEALAAKLDIRSTPTFIVPDGRVFPGARSAEDVIKFVDSPLPPLKK
ncbi:DsbC family protein [bacterium]|nr:MAG: DsbC family protein [bacterium]